MNFKIIIKALNYIWKYCRYWIFLSGLNSIILGILPIASIYIMRKLINTVSLIINNTSNAYLLAFFLLTLQFIVLFSDSILRNIQGYMDQKTSVNLDYIIQKQISQRVNEMPYIFIDNPEYYNHLQRIKGSSGSRLLSPIHSLFSIVEAITSVTTLLAFLFSIHWSLVLISIVSAIPIVLVMSFFGNKNFLLNLFITPKAREAMYIQDLITLRDNAKEIRLFNLHNYFTERWSNTFLSNAKETLKLLKTRKKAEVGLDGLTALFYTCAAGVIIWLTKKSAVRIGSPEESVFFRNKLKIISPEKR